MAFQLMTRNEASTIFVLPDNEIYSLFFFQDFIERDEALGGLVQVGGFTNSHIFGDLYISGLQYRRKLCK